MGHFLEVRLFGVLPLVAVALLSAGCPPNGENVDPPPPSGGPSIRSITPDRGGFGSRIALRGNRFGSDPAAIEVTFEGAGGGRMTLTPLSLIGDTLEVLVPSVVAEEVELSVKVGSRTSAPVSF